VALRRPRRMTLFRDVALLAAVMRDDLMASSLEQLYLEPLRGGGDDGCTLRDTLRAYLACGCSASSAASALGVNRHTVEGRVRRVELRLGRPLPTWRAEMEVALRVEQLNSSC
jgi:DNA-binding PucR family transcriptional regulator